MGAVLRQRTTSLLSRMFAATKLYCRAAKLARQRLDAAVVHVAHRLQRRSVQAWVGHVTKRRRKAALEAAALQSHRSRLLLHGCRGWLQGGMMRRTARVEVDTQAPSQLVLFSPVCCAGASVRTRCGGAAGQGSHGDSRAACSPLAQQNVACGVQAAQRCRVAHGSSRNLYHCSSKQPRCLPFAIT
eukprot:COSAG04_NODE_4077_length_2320_cov_1.870329_2_plen_186_part_00